MDLPTVTALLPQRTRTDLADFRPGDAWLAGGTWLFSEPQDHLTRLCDLTAMDWPAVTVTDTGRQIAATCTIDELFRAVEAFPGPTATLTRQCCDAFLASFKVWHTATVGGNLCSALPAGPMISLAAALDAQCEIWSADGSRTVPALRFVTGPQATVLQPGELLRGLHLGTDVMLRRNAFRQFSLTPLGRSAALVIGTRDADAVAVTVTAATPRPFRVRVPVGAAAAEIGALVDGIVRGRWYDDVHGHPDWRRHLTHRFAAEIVAELS